MQIYQNKRYINVVFTGSSFLHKYFYHNCGRLVKLPIVDLVDRWEDDREKIKYSVRVRLKK